MKSIHFICRGNVYRSRLAEALARSILEEKNRAKISSSGIEAKKALNGDVSAETVRLLSEENLRHYLYPVWRQTTQEVIEDNELIVFMSQTLYAQAKEMFKIPKDKVQVWNIPDKDGVYPDIKNKVAELLQDDL